MHGGDEITETAVSAMLDANELLQVIAPDPDSRPDVIVVVADDVIGSSTFSFLRRFQSAGGAQGPRVVVVADRFRSEDMLVAVECGVTALLARNEIKESTLASAVLAVHRGAALIPFRLQGILLSQLNQLRLQVLTPAGLTLTGVEARERDVLRLIADGYQTDEIAGILSYSEGTVKNVLYGWMARMRLNSRAQAVAYAMRVGVI
ncbi:helix-turn-helix transcriptional regulator [Amycolatopsis oliviviridis]